VLHSQAGQIWKIADFGFTAEGGSSREQFSSSRRGTSSYYSPELLRYGTYSPKSDIWALGCILFELFNRRPAFRNEWEIVEIRSGPVRELEMPSLELPSCVQCDGNLRNYEGKRRHLLDLNDVLKGMLSVEVDQRPTARALHRMWLDWEE
jgi:serine/threonine protein kinase